MLPATLPLPYPRRTRRRLLLPPGLLALAWLLWLGCVAVPQLWGIHKQTVVQVTFPPLHPDLELIPAYRKGDYLLPYLSPTRITAFRPWQTFALTGDIFEDYFALHGAQTAISWLEADPEHDRGLRVHLGQHASYANLIQLLDWCNVYNMKKYWVDIHHEPTTLYTFTTKPKPAGEKPPYFVCGGGSSRYTYQSKSTSSLEYLAPFLAPDWRNSLLLLLLIGGLSAGRMGRR